ncbi:MAG: hypothetical protein KAJ56_05280, partial [Candidatus Aenigmarchaeota archaeon]|nr:hypothetical protein [Candidatus Aenigmarchaeota archaeon]
MEQTGGKGKQPNNEIDFGGKAKFIGLVSKLCGYLEPEQIFNLYETSRKNLGNNISFLTNYHISPKGIIIENESGMPIDDMPLRTVYESYIFSAIVLNATKLVMNKKLEKYSDALEMVLAQDDVIKNYVINTGPLFTKRTMLERIDALRADKNANSNREYLEGVYAKELQNLSDSCSKVYSSLFHTDIPQKTDAEGMLAEHYNSAETALNTEKILNTKNAFLDYIKRNANEHNNYHKILYFAEQTGNVLNFQEDQETKQRDDWFFTNTVLDFVCPMESYATTDDFFSNRYVGMYITPTPIGRGKLYVHALRESNEMQLMARYLIDNLKHGGIKTGKDD